MTCGTGGGIDFPIETLKDMTGSITDGCTDMVLIMISSCTGNDHDIGIGIAISIEPVSEIQ